MNVLYYVVGIGLLVSYAGTQFRGAVFSGSDSRSAITAASGGRSGGSRGGGGVFFWGSGYRGGK